MRLLELGELALLPVAALALDGVDLLLQATRHVVLVAGLVRIGVARGFAQALVQVAPLGEPRHGLTHVCGVGLRVGARFGGDEQALGRAHRAMSVGAQLEALAPRILAPRGVFDTPDVPHAQLAGLVVAAQLRLDLALRVVQHQVIAAPAAQLAAADA